MLRVLGGVCSANPTEARREIGYVLHHMLAVLSLAVVETRLILWRRNYSNVCRVLEYSF